VNTSSIVTIERGRYSRYFQVTRAWLSAASALASTDRKLTVLYLDAAIKELRNLKVTLTSK
jgi:hypothetical protein